VRGEVVQALPGFEFHILDADPRRIKRLRITRKRHAIRRRTKLDGDISPGSEAGDDRPAESTAN
ncbi:MAG: magnesium/cobalt efflux protein, partial [Rhizobium leguminosarum]